MLLDDRSKSLLRQYAVRTSCNTCHLDSSCRTVLRVTVWQIQTPESRLGIPAQEETSSYLGKDRIAISLDYQCFKMNK